MMRTILVPLAQGLACEPAFDAALAVASRMNSHIRAMFVRPDPDMAIRDLPEMIAAAGIGRDAIEREGRAAATAARARFDGWRSGHKIPEAPQNTRLDTCFASWAEQVGEIEQVVTHFGRVSDLIVMSRFRGSDVLAERCFDAAVFGAGRPVLLAPAKLPFDLLDHVMIAWNGSLEASHAVFGAMSLLRAATRVSIFSEPEAENGVAYGAELAEALSWYGIRCHDLVRQPAARTPGTALLAAARACEATLVVMGAYTHSRLRQTFLGGATRQVLAEAAMPVLMSH